MWQTLKDIRTAQAEELRISSRRFSLNCGRFRVRSGVVKSVPYTVDVTDGYG